MKDCDFIPMAYRERQSLRRAMRRRASMIGTLIVMIGVWVGAHQRELASAQAMLADLARQDEQIRIHFAKKAVMEAERARLEEHAILVAQLSSRTQLAVVLSDLSRRLPEALVVTEMNVRSAGLSRFVVQAPESPAGSSPAARSAPANAGQLPIVPASDAAALSVTGIARSPQDVIGFAAALEGSRLFDRVQIQSQGSTTWAGRRGEKFEITCDIMEQKAAEP